MTHKVFVFCDNSARHPRRKPHIPVATFVRNAGGDGYELTPPHGRRSDMTSLDGDTPVKRGGKRLRWRFECYKCGPDSVVVAQDGTLFAVLDECRHAGLPTFRSRG